MKPKFRFVPPSRADRTLLPAALAAALALMAVAQLALTDPVELPFAGPVGVGAPLAAVREPQPRGVPGIILSRPIFAPAGGGAAGGEGAAPADPLGGAAILGTVGVGHARYAIVQVDGATRRVGLGGLVAGWRLIGLGQDGALLARGGERLRRPYGAGGGGAQGNGEASQGESQSEDQE